MTASAPHSATAQQQHSTAGHGRDSSTLPHPIPLHPQPRTTPQVFWHILTKLAYYRELTLRIDQLAAKGLLDPAALAAAASSGVVSYRESPAPAFLCLCCWCAWGLFSLCLWDSTTLSSANAVCRRGFLGSRLRLAPKHPAPQPSSTATPGHVEEASQLTCECVCACPHAWLLSCVSAVLPTGA